METQQVDGFCDEGHLRLVGEIHTPDQVVDGLVTVVHLVGDGTLAQIQQCRPDGEVLREDVVQIDTEHALVGLVGVVHLRLDLDGRARSQNALVDDGHHAHVVVDGVIDVFRQCDTAGGHLHRFGGAAALEVELRAVRRAIATFDIVFVLVRDLLRHRLRHGVQRVEGVFVGQRRIVQHCAQVLAERLCRGEIDASVTGVDGTAVEVGTVDEVEDTIRGGILMLVQPVKAHQTDQRDALLFTLREEAVRRALRIARVEDVQAELVR